MHSFPELSGTDPDRDLATARYRAFFLDVVRGVEPDVLQSLRPLVRRSRWMRALLSDGRTPRPLAAWGRRWNLSDTWILETAAATLEEWYEVPKRPRIKPLEWGTHGMGLDLPPSATPVRVAWDPLMESRRAFLARTRRAAEAHCDGVDAAAAVVGFRPAGLKRDAAHFEQLALYQVQRWSYAEIARFTRASSVFAIRQAVQATAHRIGLTLRAGGKGGRPRLTKRTPLPEGR